MTGPAQSGALPRSRRFKVAASCCWTIFLAALVFPALAPAQNFLLDKKYARSNSGQFIVYAPAQFSNLARTAKVVADTNYVRLEPALLVVSAERLKESLWRRLAAKPGTPWRGQIYLVIHPAQSLDESVTIVTRRLADGWDYRLEIPDVLTRTRLTRALTGVLLLESANRGAQSRSAEIPAWLADGLAQELLAGGSLDFIISTPDKVVNGLPVTRLNASRQGLDPQAAALRVLQTHVPLTFEQLSWPTGVQQSGKDGGVYWASAQLFVVSLLDLKDGQARMRDLLESLPRFYNWQLALQSAFKADFPGPLEVEKWWALQTATYAVRDPGPLWTAAASRARLEELLRVPVEARSESNTLPAHAEISLQTVIRSMDPEKQKVILGTTLLNLGLAQFRMTPQFAALAGEYHRALAGYLGENPPASAAPSHPGRSVAGPRKAAASRTLKKLDELDARRRALETNPTPEKARPVVPAPLKF